MITFIDLAGHHKYLHTTIFGLTSYCPDCALLLVSANTGIGMRHWAGMGLEGVLSLLSWASSNLGARLTFLCPLSSPPCSHSSLLVLACLL